MTQLTHLGLKNVVSFRDAQIRIDDNNGFVVVNGINRDSNIAENTNGAGKSLLFGTLPVALYEADPLSLAKKNKKDVHGKKGSEISIEFLSNAGKQVRLEQSGTKYKFYIDGKDQQVQTQDIARQKLTEHWPLREEEFYTTCYINSQRQCDFQKSKPSQRLDFVTNLFDLQIFDRLRQHFAKKKAEIKDKETEFQTLAVQLESVERDLSKTKWDKSSNAQLRKLSAQLETVQQDLEEEYKRRSELEATLSVLEKIDKRANKYYADQVELVAHETDLKLFQRRLDEQLDYLDAQDAYEEKLEAYEKRLRKLKSEKRDLDADIKALRLPSKVAKALGSNIDKLVERLESTHDELKDINREIRDQEAVIEEIDEIIGELNELGFDSIAAVDLDRDVEGQLAMGKAVIDLADQLEGHRKCPTCLQSVDIKTIQRQAKKARKDIDELRDYKRAQKLVRSYEEIKDQDTDIDALRKRLDKNSVTIKSTKERLQKLRDYESAIRELETVTQRLGDLQEPSKPRGKIHYSSIPEDELEDYLDRIDLVLKQYDSVLGLIDDSDIRANRRKELTRLFKQDETRFFSELKKLTAKTRMLSKSNKSKLSKLKDQNDSISEQTIRLESAKSNWKLLQDQKLELDGRMEEARPIIQQKKIIETLFVAYGNTNLKLQGAAKILKLIEANLNKYSHLVFPETMQFSLDAGTRGIDAIVTRRDGTPSDISKLSGAETNCFRLLFAISILPLIPASRRTNFMILDEPDSACSDAVREHLAKEFIPKLRAIVPHVFWITPKDSDVFKESETWVVEKQQGVSSVNIGNS